MSRPPLLVVALALAAACGGRPAPASAPDAGARPPAARGEAGPPAEARPSPEAGPPPEAGAEPARPGCEELRSAALAALEARLASFHSCRWDVDCVLAQAATAGCAFQCPVPVAAAGVVEARAALAELGASTQEALSQAGCCGGSGACQPGTAQCVDGACAAGPPTARPAPEIPPGNDPGLAAPPPRPPPGDAEERARRLFEAIVADDPPRARDFFFPREAFLVLKAIEDPGTYYDRLLARYDQDLHALHASTPELEGAEFVRLELARRGGWVGVGEEANRLPYWASRHSSIVYRAAGGGERRIEVRVLITWGERWYVTHLSEFR